MLRGTMSPLRAHLLKAEKATNTSPTQAQIEAGNYAKGQLAAHGMVIKIENPKGSLRRGVAPGGKKWERKMLASYGYFHKTMAADGDAVDCFIGPDPDSHFVAAIDQMKGDTFDETKFVLGTKTKEEAEKLYLAHYPRGWKLGPVSTTTVQQLKNWLRTGDTKSPFGGQMLKAAAGPGSDYFVTENVAFDRAVEAMEEGKDKEMAKRGHGYAVGSCGHGIRGCRCPSSVHDISLTLDIPCEDCAGADKSADAKNTCPGCGEAQDSYYDQCVCPGHEPGSHDPQAAKREALRKAPKCPHGVNVPFNTCSECITEKSAKLHPIHWTAFGEPPPTDAEMEAHFARPLPKAELFKGTFKEFCAQAGLRKSAGLRPIEERLKRLYIRRGECAECRKPNTDGLVCDCGKTIPDDVARQQREWERGDRK